MSRPTVSHRAVLISLRLLAVAAVAAVALSAASTADAAPPKLIAERPAFIGPFDGAIDQLDADGDVVAWEETRLPRRPGGDAAYRTAVLVGGVRRRSAWRRHRQVVEVGPAVDASGRVRTRVRTTNCGQAVRCSGARAMLSPWTLRPVGGEVWVDARGTAQARRAPAVVGRTFATDGSGVIRPDPQTVPEAPPSFCTFRLLGQAPGAAPPSIDDCRLNWAYAEGPLAIASYTRPSEYVPEPDGKNWGQRTRIFVAADRTAAKPSWVGFGSYAEGRGTTDGVQAFCVLGDRIVVLDGYTDAGLRDGGRWSMHLTAIRPDGGTRHSLKTPELGLDPSGDMPPVQLACTDRWVYAVYLRSWPETERSPVARLVRYRMPG